MRHSHSKKATIFIQNATILDCAIALDTRGPQGFSWSVDSVWEGESDDCGILLDFGSAKRLVRDTIDEEFDHRLFVCDDQITKLDATSNRILATIPWDNSGKSGYLILHCPSDSIAVLEKDCLASEGQNQQRLEEYLAKILLGRAPKNVSSIKIVLKNTQEHQNNFFRYIHALPFHTGNCQRFHGHSSMVEVLRNGVLDSDCSAKIAREMDGRFFLAKKFITPEPKGTIFEPIIKAIADLHVEQSEFAFASFVGSQGEIALALPNWALLELPQESTIENLADFIKQKFLATEDARVVVYEGLQKGAMSW